MQRLYRALEERLVAYLRRLQAAEEISRLTSLSTVVRMVIEDEQLHNLWGDVRALQACIAETQGWSGCSPERIQRIGALSKDAAELTLQHASSLLSHCERGAEEQLRLSQTVGVDTEDSAGTADTPENLAMSARGDVCADSGLPESPAALISCVYRELCTWLLVPRAEEVERLWAGLRARGWSADRVERLNEQMALLRSLHHEAIERLIGRRHSLPSGSSPGLA